MSIQLSEKEFMTGSHRDAAILSLLGAAGVQVIAERGRQWELTLAGDFTAAGTGHCEPHWLVLDFPLRGDLADTATPDAWPLLQLNEQAGAFVKVVTGRPPNSEIRVRGEMPLDCCDAEDLGRRISELCAALRDLAQATVEELTEFPDRQAEPLAGGAGVDLPTMAVLGGESGWPVTERAGGARLSARLESERAPFHAIVERLGSGEIGVWADLATWAADDAEGESALPAACRSAVGALLMNASGMFRLARGAVVVDDGEWTCRFEARLPRDAGPADLSHALSALSVAVEFCGPEAQLLLNHPNIAQAFLAEGWSPAVVNGDGGSVCPVGALCDAT